MTLRAKSDAPPRFRVILTYSDGPIFEVSGATPGALLDMLYSETALELLERAVLERE